MNQPAPGTFSPATGEALAPVPASTEAEIDAVVARAREAQHRWAQRSLGERIVALERVAQRMLANSDAIIDILVSETGKSRTDAKLNEISSVGVYLASAVKEAHAALAPVAAKLSPLDYPGKKITIEALPRGVVGIIAPWNYALGNFYKPIFPALLSGNAVVLKPSEYTPRAGAWLRDQFEAELPAGVVGIVQGGGEAGAALLDRVDAATFTGSVATGRKVAMRAAERLIPCSVELGGKDAAIVLADCNLDRTVAGVAQWGLHNCGQNCAAIERVYVVQAIADDFVRRLGAVADALDVAPDGEHADIGPLQSHMQLSIVERHVEDALAKGAVLVAGGKRTGTGLGYRPTVLDNCTADMLVMTDETFGPVIAVQRVAEPDEAVRLANDSPYGLNGSVWTTNITLGTTLARRLDVGVAYVNNHAFGGALANVPWTGVKDTGTGIAASRYSYGTFTRPRTLFVDSNSNPDPWWFPMNGDLSDMGDLLIARSKGSISALLKLVPLLGKRVKAIKKLSRGD